jgi:hypothetical protein
MTFLLAPAPQHLVLTRVDAGCGAMPCAAQLIEVRAADFACGEAERGMAEWA